MVRRFLGWVLRAHEVKSIFLQISYGNKQSVVTRWATFLFSATSNRNDMKLLHCEQPHADQTTWVSQRPFTDSHSKRYSDNQTTLWLFVDVWQMGSGLVYNRTVVDVSWELNPNRTKPGRSCLQLPTTTIIPLAKMVNNWFWSQLDQVANHTL